MADFPDNVYELRDIENLPGLTYDVDKKNAIFAEDIQGIADEVTAIETFFQGAGYSVDDDVTVTEFFGSAVDLGTGGKCRVVMIDQGLYWVMYINIIIGASPSLGTLPLVILTDDLPVEIPTFSTGQTVPGSFGALSQASNAVQMFAPACNNIGGYQQCILFFKESGASYLDYLMGVSCVPTLGEDDFYSGSIIIPKTNIYGL